MTTRVHVAYLAGSARSGVDGDWPGSDHAAIVGMEQLTGGADVCELPTFLMRSAVFVRAARPSFLRGRPSGADQPTARVFGTRARPAGRLEDVKKVLTGMLACDIGAYSATAAYGATAVQCRRQPQVRQPAVTSVRVLYQVIRVENASLG